MDSQKYGNMKYMESQLLWKYGNVSQNFNRISQVYKFTLFYWFTNDFASICMYVYIYIEREREVGSYENIINLKKTKKMHSKP